MLEVQQVDEENAGLHEEGGASGAATLLSAAHGGGGGGGGGATGTGTDKEDGNKEAGGKATVVQEDGISISSVYSLPVTR